MATLRWIDGGDERRMDLDPAASPGGRYLAVRRRAEDDWTTACVLLPGEPEREVGEGLVDASVAEDAVLKYAISTLAQLHGVSPAPGIPEEEAGPAEVLIAGLWRVLTERWAPPGAG